PHPALPPLHRAQRDGRALRRIADPGDDPALHLRRLHDGRVEGAGPDRPRRRGLLRLAPRRPRDGVHRRQRLLHHAHRRQRRHHRRHRRAALPALRKQGYPSSYALGLVTVGGSLGLLLPPSLPILVYALVAGIDFNAAFKAGILPGVMIMAFLALHAAYVGSKYKVPRSKPNLREMGAALWLLKWELG